MKCEAVEMCVAQLVPMQDEVAERSVEKLEPDTLKRLRPLYNLTVMMWAWARST